MNDKPPSRPVAEASSAWVAVWKYRTPIDPEYGGPTTVATLWRDNLGGLVLGIDQADGQTVTALPLPAADADDLAAAIVEHLTGRPSAPSAQEQR